MCLYLFFTLPLLYLPYLTLCHTQALHQFATHTQSRHGCGINLACRMLVLYFVSNSAL